MALRPEDVQLLFRGGSDAWAPRDGEARDAFVRRKAPSPPGFWRPLARRDFSRALDHALSRGEQRDRTRALVLPFWWGNNEDEVESDEEWRATTIVTSEVDDTLLFDAKLPKATALWARVEISIVKGTFVTLSRHYALGVKGVERFGTFATIDTHLRTIVEGVTAGDRVALTPSPARMVPPFSMHYVPAFDLARVPPDVAEAATRIAAKLSFEPDE